MVKVYEGDKCIVTINENEPEARQCAINLPAEPKGEIHVGLSIRDIFNRTTAEVRLQAVTSKTLDPVMSTASNTMISGLTYRYYQTDKPETWSKLPDFAKLTPKRPGVVATPDITPRLARKGYAFEYSGYLRVPATGIYTFDMVVASGGKLTIHDQTVIDADGDRSIAPYSGAIALKAGLHPVRIEYYHGALWRHQADDFLQHPFDRPVR